MSGGLATGRREMLAMLGAGLGAGLGASMAAGSARAAPAPDEATNAALQRTLDGLAALPTPVAQLQALAGFNPARLSPGARADLLTVRYALQCDQAIAELPLQSTGRYPLYLARACGASIGVDSAERRLQAEGARLQAIAARLFDRIGIPGQKSGQQSGQRFSALFADPRFLYAEDDSGRAAAIADMTRWLADACASLPRWFGPLPAVCRDVSVASLSPADLAAGKRGYRILPEPGRAGVYFVDLRDIRRRPGWTLRSVVHHELLPGHMVQLPIEAIAKPHPLRLRDAKAFTEGWAIYAEMLAWHGGLCANPAQELGIVHWLLFRVTRGLVDIGIHARGWSAAQALAFLTATMGEPVYFAPFASDIKAIAAQPGQRVAEILTAYTLADGAAKAKVICAYHMRVLANGALPIAQILAGTR